MDWMNLSESFLRWIHVLAGIVWIGHLYFFNFVNASFAPTMDAETKKKVVPELMPRALFWFRWGAAATWITGLALLILVFYHGRQALDASDESRWTPFAMAMLLVTFVSPFIYDAAVRFVLKTNVAAFWGGFVLVCATLWAFKAAGFSNRGVQIHMGGLFGTIMAYNVWFVIWPAQKQIIAAVKAGQKPEDALVATAGARSRHNTFLSVPLVFFMVNQHNTWSFTSSDPFPVYSAVVVLAGWALTQHLLMGAKKVKGF